MIFDDRNMNIIANATLAIMAVSIATLASVTCLCITFFIIKYTLISL